MNVSDYPFERFSSRRLYYSFDFLPGTRDIVYSANTSGQFNLWRQGPPSNSDMGPARQLTGFVDWTVRHLAPGPGGDYVLVFADHDGDENYQVFKVDPDEGWQTPIVFKPEVRNTFGITCISPNGKYAAYSSNERERRDMDIVVTDLRTGITKPILAGGATYDFGYWSPDSGWATVVEELSTDDFNLHLVNMRNGKERNLTPHEKKTVYIPGPWTPKGDSFFLTTDAGREYSGLAYIPVSNGGHMKWLETPKADIEDVALSPNGRVLAWAENREGYSYIHLRDLRTGRRLGRPVNTGGALLRGWFENLKIIKFSPDSKRLVFLLSTPTRPPEIYVMTLPKLVMERFTSGFIGNVPEKTLIEPELVRYQSFDREVPAFLYKPKLEKGKRGPVVVVIHGGPESQDRPWYSYAGLYQYLVNRGIGVLALNIRGSTGYGRSYRSLIHRDWGGGELKDIDHSAKYLKSLDWVDPDRIGVFGGSFGGFATLSATTRLPEHWRAAVDIFGPSNLVTFAKAVPEHWKRFMADWVGDPDKEADFLLSRSPMTYIENLKCPILIIQGAKDPRVVKPESDQIVEKLRSMGRTVEYVVFPDEGHGFTKLKNEFTAFTKSVEFLERNLLGGSS